MTNVTLYPPLPPFYLPRIPGLVSRSKSCFADTDDKDDDTMQETPSMLIFTKRKHPRTFPVFL